MYAKCYLVNQHLLMEKRVILQTVANVNCSFFQIAVGVVLVKRNEKLYIQNKKEQSLIVTHFN